MSLLRAAPARLMRRSRYPKRRNYRDDVRVVAGLGSDGNSGLLGVSATGEVLYQHWAGDPSAEPDLYLAHGSKRVPHVHALRPVS